MAHHNEFTGHYGSGKKTLQSCMVGFILSLALTVAAFWLVGYRVVSNENLYISLAALALAQLIVQVFYFIRLDLSKEERWNLMAFLFAVVIIAVLVAGSLWIMYNLNYNMVH